MEIGWVGILLLLTAWACMGVSTGFDFYVHTKDKDYEISETDRNYILVAGVTAAVAVGLTTVVALLVILFGKKDYKEHIERNHHLTVKNMELQNQIDDLTQRVEQHRREKHPSVLDNPIPLRRGRRGRPLIT